MKGLNESAVEQAALAWLESMGWPVKYGPEIAPDMPAAERDDYCEVVLKQGRVKGRPEEVHGTTSRGPLISRRQSAPRRPRR